MDLSRAFLDTNGAHQETDVYVEIPNKEGNVLDRASDVGDVKKKCWILFQT